MIIACAGCTFLSLLYPSDVSAAMRTRTSVARAKPVRTMVMSLSEKKTGSRLSPMVDNMAVSKTIEIHSLTKEMERNGQTVYSLCVGEPDYQPPEEVIEATGVAAVRGNTKYTAVNGDSSLRTAIANDLNARKGTKYTADQIIVSNGAKQSVLQTLLSVVSPGDEVIIPAPYWPSYPDMVKMCGAKPVIIETLPSDGYVLQAEVLKSYLESHSDPSKVKCLILCNPSNPTGSVAGEQSLARLAEAIKPYPNLLVLADEIYEQLTYDVPHISFASLPDMSDRTITVNGFSKSHSMTGYRIGYSASPMDIAKACGKLQSQMTSCASSIGQEAAEVALRVVSPGWIVDRVSELKGKRDLAYGLITSIPSVTCPKPDGAFYLLPDVKAYYGKKTPSGRSVRDSHELCLELLRDEQVALVSGDAFGAPDCIRLSYAASTDLIEQSILRLRRFLLSLS